MNRRAVEECKGNKTCRMATTKSWPRSEWELEELDQGVPKWLLSGLGALTFILGLLLFYS